MAAGVWTARTWHRALGVAIAIGTLWLAVTGMGMQVVDLRAILSHAPGTDKEMVQIREGVNGPGNFVVIQPGDFEAEPLPAGMDAQAALGTVLAGARRVAGEGVGFRYVDLRMAGGRPVGDVRAGERVIRVDAASGARLPSPPREVNEGAKSWHLKFKVAHVLRGTNRWITVLHLFVGIGLFTLTLTGMVIYARLWRARRRGGRRELFWRAGGVWRSLHRGIALGAAVFLLVISATGTMLAIDQVGYTVFKIMHGPGGRYAGVPDGGNPDVSSPIADARFAGMLRTTMEAEQRNGGRAAVKAIRLRTYAGVPQGVVIAGSGPATKQLVFQAETGRPMGLTEPEYPKTHYYLGWQEHEWMKQIHRGDAFGVSGRVVDLLSGLSLVYLTISGLVMYGAMWRARRRAGRGTLVWS